METVKLQPATKDYIWGGTKLKKWGKKASSEHIAECWEVSFNDDGPCIIASGEHEGEELRRVVTEKDLGRRAASFKFFPILNKLIDAESNLSVQVHPSDDYALGYENQFGKTEMWYVISAEKGSGLYIGFNRRTSPEEVAQKVEDGTIIDLLNFQEVEPGQVYFIESGTVHAIGAGVTIMEIQQNSTLTYRLYDYKRLGKDGKPRELHVEKALKVLNYDVYKQPSFEKPIIGKSEYFEVSTHDASNETVVEANEESFATFTFVDECEGTVNGISYKQGDSFFVPSGKKAIIKGNGTYIKTII